MNDVDATVAMDPDERALRADLNRVDFQMGVDRGRWRLVDIDWPHAVVAIAAPMREDSPTEFFLRLQLDGYPDHAPIVTPWDPTTGTILPAERRPRGEVVAFVFRSDWENGRALYAPYDRVALSSHGNWAAEHPADTWAGSCDITFILKRVHRLLDSDDYLGATR